MSFSIIYRLFIWVIFALILFASTGLTHMYARSITLAYVQGYDFMIFKKALDQFSVNNPDEKIVMESVINVLGGDERVLFPVAIVSKDICLENNSINALCEAFPTRDIFSREINAVKVHDIYKFNLRLNVADLGDGNYVVYDRLLNGDFLIAKTTPYLISGNDFLASERIFASEAYKYFATADGFYSMYRKSYGSWFFIAIVMLVLFVFQERRNFKNISYLQRADQDKLSIERRLLKSNDLLSQAEAEKNLLESEVFAARHKLEQSEGIALSNATLLEAVKEKESELEKASSRIKIIEDDHLRTLEELIEKEHFISGLLSKIPKQDVAEVAENDNEKLNRLRRLWIDGKLTWDDRLKIESEVSLAKLGRTPFTDYIAYISLERWVTLSCEGYSLINSSKRIGLQDQIDILKENNIISRDEADFLHEARVARNKWFHGDKQPAQALTVKVVKFLKRKKRPVIEPRV